MKKQIMIAVLFLQFVTTQFLFAQMRIHLINVGQGCATLVEFPCGAILIDAGGETNAQIKSNDLLKAYLDDFFMVRTDLNRTLNAVYLTHPHKDHTLGVPVLLQAPYMIKNVVTDGLDKGSGKAGQIMLHNYAQSGDATPSDLSDDIGMAAVNTDMIGTGGLTNSVIDPVNCSGVDPVITMLWGTSKSKPSGWSQTEYDQENNHSLVIKIEYGTSSLLITGDLEEEGQVSLLNKYNGTQKLNTDVYLVGHHGSKNGTSQALLNAMTPKMALIGVGDASREIPWSAWKYGHPNKGILDMLESSLTSTREQIHVPAGDGATNFADYTITKAIYATAWDDDVVLEADANGNWQREDDSLVPGLVDINTASAIQLEILPGIGQSRAQAIIDYRIANGDFTTIEALVNVNGIGPATLNLMRSYVKV